MTQEIYQKFFNSLNFTALVLCVAVILLNDITAFAQSSGGSDARQSAETKNKSDANLKGLARVNPSTLAMEISVPLVNYPGRAGNSLPITFNYSSKVWQINPGLTWFYYTPYGGIKKYVTDVFPRYAEHTAAGWTSSLLPPRLDSELTIYDQYGKKFDLDFDEAGAASYYQQMESAILNGGSQSNLIEAPTQCGLVCTEGLAPWGCRGYSIIRCMDTTFDQPDPTGGGGGGGGGGGTPPPPPQMHYVKRIRIQMPDGSMHEFRKSDAIFSYCASNSPYNGPNCEQDGEDRIGDFIAVDGSGMRLNRTTDNSTLYLPDGGRYIFPSLPLYSGQQWYATEFIDANGNKTTFSEVYDSNGRVLNRTIDTLGREVFDPLPHNWDSQTQDVGVQPINVRGLNGQLPQYSLKWSQLKGETAGESALENPDQALAYETARLCHGNLSYALPPEGSANTTLFGPGALGIRLCSPEVRGNNNEVKAVLFNPTVLTEISLPNGKGYRFKYDVYGEITRIDYPTGNYETFTYARIIPLNGANSPVFDQTNRGVIERRVYNANNELEQRWRYSASINDGQYPIPSDAPYKVTITAPKKDDPMGDGVRSERFLNRFDVPRPEDEWGNFGFEDPRSGMPKEENIYGENGVLRSRTLTEWIAAPPRAETYQYAEPDDRAVRDPRVTRTVSVTIENGQALATLSQNEYETPGLNGSTAPTESTYFAHLNLKRSKSHHFRNIPLSLAQTGTLEQIASYFNSSTVATISETDYLYDENYKARGISSLPIETRTVNPADNSVLAKTQTVYDELTYLVADSGTLSGSLVTTWVDPLTDQSIPANSRTLRAKPTTAKLWDSDNGTWIQKHTQFDQYGNVRKAWEPNEAQGSSRFVETIYSADYAFAYPTQVITPGADQTDTHGTTAGSTATTTYDPVTGLPLTVTDEFGQITATEYNDPLLRPTRVYGQNFTAPETQTIYDDTNLTVKVRKQLDANNWDEATTFMDSLGRTIKTQAKDSQGDVFVETHYDNLGRVDRVTNPYRAGDTVYWSKTRYDEMGRAVETFAPTELPNLASAQSLGTTSYEVSTVPAYFGIAVTTTDAAGKNSRSITNALGQLIVVEEPDSAGNLNPLPQSTPQPTPTPNPTPPKGGGGGCLAICSSNFAGMDYPSYATFYKYNALGKMVQVTQGVQNRYFLYDSLGRLIRVRQPEQEVNTALNLTDPITGNSQWTAGFTYDVLGNVITATDANGTVIHNEYDRANRVTRRYYTGEPSGQTTPEVNFWYDGKGLASQQSPNYAKGKLTKVDNTVSATLYTQFDNFGRLKEMEQRTPFGTQTMADATAYVSKYTYNLSGALVEEEYPSGRVVKNEFESDGDLYRVMSKKANAGNFLPYASNFSYTASGGTSQMELGNGRWETAKFNPRLQVYELGLGTTPTDTSTWKVNYEYGELDANGNVDATKNTGNIARQTLTVPGTSFVQSYRYDSLYRLTEAVEKTGTTQNWIQNWAYDRYGNRTSFSENVNGFANSTTPAVDTNTNRFTITGTNFQYDLNGNLVHDADGRQFTFNGDNKQTIVKDAGSNVIGQYFYDSEGKRVKKVTNTETTVFVYSSGKLVAEYSTLSSQTPSVSYTTTDHLGSPRIITDQFGQVKSRRDFMPFGEDLFAGVGSRNSALSYGSSPDDVRQKFTGYQKDSETGLDFAEARMYANSFGRFTAVDPLLASGKSADPQSFNRYVYVGNSPLTKIDPTGQFGDYYDKDGRYLGNDGNRDGLVYFAHEVRRDDKHVWINGWTLTSWSNVAAAVSARLHPTSTLHSYENQVVRALAGNVADGFHDGVTGTLKGIGNFPAATWNGMTDMALNPHGCVITCVQNPFEVSLPFSANNAKQTGYMSAGTIGTGLGLGAAGTVFSGSSMLSVVPEELTALSTTERLQFHVTRAAQEVDALGDAAFTPRQLGALRNNPGLRPAFRGNRIDVMARNFVKDDPALSFVESNYNRGPDFVHPRTGQWWDMTTRSQWQRHFSRYEPTYGSNGTFLSTH